MSEKGQKIFKWVVWILLIVGLSFSCYRWVDKLMNPDITKTEWMSLLGSKIDRDYTEGHGDEIVTGRDVAVLSMKALGEKRLKYLIDGELTDEKLIDLADELDIVNKNKLDKTYNEKEAEKVLSDLLDYYSDPETYPVYDETEYSDNVIFTNGLDIEVSNDDSGIATITSTGAKLEPGKILLIKNEHGIAEAKKVVSCENSDGENEYIVTMEEIDSLSEVASHFSFSGCSDFSYLDNFVVDDESVNMDSNTVANSGSVNNILSIAPMTVYAAEIDKSTPKTTLEFGIAVYTEEIINVKDNQSEDSIVITVKKDGVDLELKNPISGESDEPDDVHTKKEVSLGGTVTIKNL